jgi:hypothetical protein
MQVIESISWFKNIVISAAISNKLRKRQELRDELSVNMLLAKHERDAISDHIKKYDEVIAAEYAVATPPEKVIAEARKLEQEAAAYSLVTHSHGMHQLKTAYDPKIPAQGTPYFFEDEEMRQSSLRAQEKLRDLCELWMIPVNGLADLARWNLLDKQGRYMGTPAYTRKPGSKK